MTGSQSAQEVKSLIQKYIQDGRALSSGVLIPERRLAELCAVSRPTIREALLYLAAEGVIEKDDNRRWSLSLQPASNNQITELMSRFPALNQDFFDFRRVLEGEIAYYAAQNVNNASLAYLQQAFNALEDAHLKKDIVLESECDFRFHLAIAKCAANAVLLETSLSLLYVLEHHIRENLKALRLNDETREVIYGQHRDLMRAIVTKDPSLAKRIALKHVRSVSSLILGKFR